MVFFRISNQSLLVLLFMVLTVKAMLLIVARLYGHDVFGGGNDSNYYHAYALGYDNVAVNVWPIILRFLADYGFYSRDIISYFLVFLSVLIIPYTVSKLAVVKGCPVKNNVFVFLFFIVSVYPNLFYLSLDIYRDVFMIFIFTIGLIVFKKISEYKLSIGKVVWFVTALAISFILYKFRPYLGFGYFSALVLSWAYSFRRYPFYISVFGLLLVLFFLNLMGFMDSILKYREAFHNGMEGGSNIGITFDSKVGFGFDLIKSFIYQMMGFYFPNKVSFIAFLSESVIFIYAFFYLIKNRQYSNKFVDYLIVFFVAYGVVWLLGNDNLGSATRLRMFNYIVVYIGAFIVYQNKFIVNRNLALK